jgi:alpha-tubulin suppressor-like RCC1 family protein
MPTFYTFSIDGSIPSLNFVNSFNWTITGNGKTVPYTGRSTGAGSISFRTIGSGYVFWNISVSSEDGYDHGSLTIGGIQIFRVSGVQNRSGNQFVQNGTTISISYTKDGSVDANLDRTTINSLYFVPIFEVTNFSFDDIFVPVDYFSFGNLSSWGLNSNGQLGLNDYDSRNIPTKVYYNLNDWKKISAGQNFASAIRSDGTLWIWGFGADGQLGNGSDDSSTIPYMLASQSNFVDVSCGESHMGAVKSDGSIWMWGNGGNNQLGNNSVSSTVPIQLGTGYFWKKISCGYNYTCAISITDQLWVWGGNNYGQLGLPTLNDKTVQQINSLNECSSVSCAKYHTVAIKTNGSLHSTGTNIYGQLGTGNLTNRTSFVQVGIDTDWKQVSCAENHTIAIKTNGTMWAWGNNDSGQLGFGVGIASTSKPIQIGFDINWKQVSCGSSCSSAIKTDGSLWTWGLNNSDQLGLGSGESDVIYLPTQIGTDVDWKQVSTRNSNFYAIKYNTLYV